MSANFHHRLGLIVRELGGYAVAAEMIDRPESVVRRWVQGSASPPFVDAVALCRRAGRGLDWLAFDVAPAPPRGAPELTVVKKEVE